MAALTKTAFSTLDPKLRHEATTLFNLARLYGSTIGIAAMQISIYCNTQAMHLALAKHLTPDRVTGYVFNAASKRGLAMLNEMITEQAGVVAVIDQFKILMIAMLIVSPLVLLLCKPYVRG
jgi:DHA2 family multidrug resistance protein